MAADLDPTGHESTAGDERTVESDPAGASAEAPRPRPRVPSPADLAAHRRHTMAPSPEPASDPHRTVHPAAPTVPEPTSPDVPPPTGIGPAAPDHAAADAREWGRVDDAGTVYVRRGDSERIVGSWQAGDAQAGLEHFALRYADLATEVGLLEHRLASGAGDPKSTTRAAHALRAGLDDAKVVGDIDALERRLATILQTADDRAGELAERRTAARKEAAHKKEALVEEAERIGAKDGSWKASGDRLRALVDEWQTIKGVDRRTERALWIRFRAARDAFNHRRGAHFAALDEARAESRTKKQAIVAEAEDLADSTDWDPTATQLKALMARWKAAGQAPKGAEDELWRRFQAAQDRFFAARNAAFGARDEEELAHQRTKESIIAEVDALDSSQDPATVAATLRRLGDRFDAVGRVPRSASRALEERMRAAEQRVRRTPSPVAASTASPLLIKLREAVGRAESQLAKATAAGDLDRIRRAEQDLAARRGWLADAERTAGR